MPAPAPSGGPEELPTVAGSLNRTSDAAASVACGLVREAAYAAIGLSVLTYQRIQVRRREIEAQRSR
ncbi:hypothetical protein [Ilumatobacter sp.]|uniref:hypothetical protein n=1 Tax=Ilumatobacter sp. TaxID=1967498 RepID=UPI003B51B717